MLLKKSFTDIEQEIKSLFEKTMEESKIHLNEDNYTEGYYDGLIDGIDKIVNIFGVDIEGVTYDSSDNILIHKYEIDDSFMYEPNPLYYRDFFYIKSIADEPDENGNVVYFIEKVRMTDKPVRTYQTMTENELNLYTKMDRVEL